MKSEFTTGSKKWSFAAGNIPFHSTGMEPAFTSNDRIAILNINSQKAEIIITIYCRGETCSKNKIQRLDRSAADNAWAPLWLSARSIGAGRCSVYTNEYRYGCAGIALYHCLS
jgi:hypothetical protein